MVEAGLGWFDLYGFRLIENLNRLVVGLLGLVRLQI